MPKQQPVLSWTQIRNYAERWSWADPRTGVKVTGYNVPEEARKSAKQVPYFLRVVTLKGELMEGEVITLKVLPKHRRLIRFTQSGEIRNIADYLIISIDGIRFVTH
jgi:hypothetical protein